MKIIEIAAKDVVLNAGIATRKGGHDPDNIERIAKSYEQRHGAGLEPQINPGLVRSVDGKYELIDGKGRLDAVLLVNEAGGLDGEELMFRAQVARADDENAIISGIQANFHNAVDVFDRADAMAKLVALGKSQRDVANIFAMNEGTVSQMLKLNEAPKKFIKAFRDGDLEQDAVVAIMDLDADDSKRTEIMEECLRHKQRFTEILAKKEFNDKKAEVARTIEEAKAKVDELKEKAKEAEKAAKEADKALSKAKDEAETKALRTAKAEADKAKKAVGTEWAKAEKELIKAKDAKEKLATQSPTAKKSKVSPEEVKSTAKAKGLTKKGGKKIEATPRSKAQLVVFLTGIAEDEGDKITESQKTLATHLIEFLDGEVSDVQLANKFKTCCKTDEQYK